MLDQAARIDNLEIVHVERRNLSIGVAVADRTHRVANLICSDAPCFGYILRGRGVFRNGETGETHPFGPGSLRFLPLHRPYTRISDAGLHVSLFLTLPAAYYGLLQDMDLVPRKRPVIEFGIRWDMVERHGQLIRRAREVTDLTLPRVVSEAFTYGIDLLLPRPAASQQWRPVMEKAAALLESDFRNDIPVPDLADELNMSCTNFRRVFASYYGTSPKTYRIRKKLEAIKSVLLTDPLLVKEVADRFGYADVYTFSRQFKKYTGLSPTAFRHQAL